MSTFAIGDIQGCFQELQLLLEAMAFNPDHDKLWLVGDLINRGPDNRRVMDFVLSLGEQVCCVLGNHDLHFVAVASGLQRPSRSDTLDDLSPHQIVRLMLTGFGTNLCCIGMKTWDTQWCMRVCHRSGAWSRLL